MTFRLSLLSILVVLALITQPQLVESHQEDSWNQQFHQQINRWIESLAKKDPQFSAWKEARQQVQTLGPNSHQWLITLSRNGANIGYLVVGEAPPEADRPTLPQFVLLEYGLGEFVLFNQAFIPESADAQPVYDGFASHWLISDHPTLPRYIDAKTGEKYPAIAKPDQPLMATLSPGEVIRSELSLLDQRRFVSEEVSPFQHIDWLVSAPLNQNMGPQATLSTLWQESKPKSVIVTAKLFQDSIIAPFTVGSVHMWEDSVAYIGVWDWGLRFVPYSYVNKVGELLIN